MGNSQFAHSGGEFRVDSSLSCCDCSRKSKYYEPQRCEKLNDIRIRSQSFARILDANCSYLTKFVTNPTSSSSHSIPPRSFLNHSNPFSCPSLGGRDGGGVGGGFNLNYNRLPSPGYTDRNSKPDSTELTQTPSSLSLNGTPGGNYDYHVNPVTMTLRGYEPSNPFNPTNFYNSDPDLSPSDDNSNQTNPFLTDKDTDNPTNELPIKKPKKSKENTKPSKQPENTKSSKQPENAKPSKPESSKQLKEPENENVGTNPTPKITRKPSKQGQNQSKKPDPNKTKSQTSKPKSSLTPNPVQNKKDSDPNPSVSPEVQNNENSPSKVPNEEVPNKTTPTEKLGQNEPNNQTPKNEIPNNELPTNANKIEPTPPQGKEILKPNEEPKQEEGVPVKPPVCECNCKCSLTENDSPRKSVSKPSEETPEKTPDVPLQASEIPVKPSKPQPKDFEKQKEDPNPSPKNDKDKSSVPENFPKTANPTIENPSPPITNNPNANEGGRKTGVVDPVNGKQVPIKPASEIPKNEPRKPSTESKQSDPTKNKPEKPENPNQIQPNSPAENTKQNQGTDPILDPSNKQGRGIPSKGSTDNKNPQTETPPSSLGSVDPVVDKTNQPTPTIDQATEPNPNPENSRKPSDDSKRKPSEIKQKQPPLQKNNQASGPDIPQNNVENPNLDEIPTSPLINDDGTNPEENITENVENNKTPSNLPNVPNVVEPNPNNSTGVPEKEPEWGVGPSQTIHGPEDENLPPPTVLENIVETAPAPEQSIDSPQNIPNTEKTPSPPKEPELEPKEEIPTGNPEPVELIPDLITSDPNPPVDEIQVTHPNSIPKKEDESKNTPDITDKTGKPGKKVSFPDSPGKNNDDKPSAPQTTFPTQGKVENPPLLETTTPNSPIKDDENPPLIPEISTSSGSPPTYNNEEPTRPKTVSTDKDKNEPFQPKITAPDGPSPKKGGGKPSIPKTVPDTPVQGDGSNVPSLNPQKKPGDNKNVKRPSRNSSSGDPKEIPLVSIPGKSNDKDSPSYHIKVPSITDGDDNDDKKDGPILKTLNGDGKVLQGSPQDPSNRKKRSSSSEQQHPDPNQIPNPKTPLPSARGNNKSELPPEKTGIPNNNKQQTKKPSVTLESPRNSLKPPSSNLNPSPSKKLVAKPQGPQGNNNKTRRPTTTSNATPSPNKTKLIRKPMDDNDIECYEPEQPPPSSSSNIHQRRRNGKSPSGKGRPQNFNTIPGILPTDDECQPITTTTVPRRRKLRNSSPRPRSVSTMTCDPIPSCSDYDYERTPHESKPKKKKAHKISEYPYQYDHDESGCSKFTDCDDLDSVSNNYCHKEQRKRVKTAPAKGLMDSSYNNIDFEKILCDPELMKKLWTKKFKIISPNEKKRCTTSTSEITHPNKSNPPSSLVNRRRKECQQEQQQQQQYPLPQQLYQSSFTCIYPSTGACPPGTIRNKAGFFVIPKKVKKACKNKSTSAMTCCNDNNLGPKRQTGLELNSSYTNADAGFGHISNQYGPSPYYPCNILPLIHNCKNTNGKKIKRKTCTSSTSTSTNNGILQPTTTAKKSSTRLLEKQLQQQKSLCRLNEGIKSLEQLKNELLMRTQLDDRQFPNNIQRECCTTRTGRSFKTCKKSMKSNSNSKQTLDVEDDSPPRRRCKKRNTSNNNAAASSVTNFIDYPSSFLSLSSRRPFSTSRLRSSATNFDEYLECYEKIIREIREAQVRKVCSTHTPASSASYYNSFSSRACRGNSCQNVITTTTTTRQQRIFDNCLYNLNNSNNWNNNSNCSSNNYNHHNQNFLCGQPLSSSLSSPLCGVNNNYNNNSGCCMYSKPQTFGNMNNMYCDPNQSFCCPSASIQIQSDRGCNLSSNNCYNNCCSTDMSNPCTTNCNSSNNYGYCIPNSYRVCSVDSLDSNSTFSPNASNLISSLSTPDKMASDTNVGKDGTAINKTDLDRAEKEFLHAMGYKTTISNDNHNNIHLESNRESDYDLGIGGEINRNITPPSGRINSNSSLFSSCGQIINNPNDVDNIDIPVSDSDPVVDRDVENLLGIISSESFRQYYKYYNTSNSSNEKSQFKAPTQTTQSKMEHGNNEVISQLIQHSCNNNNESNNHRSHNVEQVTEKRNNLETNETKMPLNKEEVNDQAQKEDKINDRKVNAIKSIKNFINSINNSLQAEETTTTKYKTRKLVSETITTTNNTTPINALTSEQDDLIDLDSNNSSAFNLKNMNSSTKNPSSETKVKDDNAIEQNDIMEKLHSEKLVSSTHNKPLKSSKSETETNLKSVLKKTSTLNHDTRQFKGEMDETSSAHSRKPKKTRSVRFSNPVVQETWISGDEENNNNETEDDNNFLHDDKINGLPLYYQNGDEDDSGNNIENAEQMSKLTLEQNSEENKEKILPATTSQSSTRIGGGISSSNNNNNKTGNSSSTSSYYAAMFGHVGVQKVSDVNPENLSSIITAYHSCSDSNMPNSSSSNCKNNSRGIKREVSSLPNPQEHHDNINTNNLFTNSSLDSIPTNNNSNNTRRNHHHTFNNCKNFASNFFRLV